MHVYVYLPNLLVGSKGNIHRYMYVYAYETMETAI